MSTIHVLPFLFLMFLLTGESTGRPHVLDQQYEGTDSLTKGIVTKELHGYMKFIPSVYFQDRADSVFSEGFLHNRINLKISDGKGLQFRAEMRNRLYYGEVVRMQPQFGSIVDDDTGWVRMAVLWVDQPGFVLLSNIDRLQVSYDAGRYSLVLGRQRINWGINTLWNPNDLFNAWNFLDFDYEERPGTDAIRLRYNASETASLELAYSPAESVENHTAAMLWRFNRSRFDYQLLAGKYKHDLVLGGGFAGHIRQTGFKGEVSWFNPLYGGLYGGQTIAASIEFDRTFKNDWYLNTAVLHNRVEDDFDLTLAGIYRSRVSPRQLMPWSWNFSISALKQISPPISASLGLVFSPEDASTILLPGLNWNVADNFYIDLIGQSFFSRQASNYQVIVNSLYLRIQLRY